MRVIAKEPISYGASVNVARRYEIGEVLEVPEDIGASLIASGAAEPLADEPESKAEKPTKRTK